MAGLETANGPIPPPARARSSGRGTPAACYWRTAVRPPPRPAPPSSAGRSPPAASPPRPTPRRTSAAPAPSPAGPAARSAVVQHVQAGKLLVAEQLVPLTRQPPI